MDGGFLPEPETSRPPPVWEQQAAGQRYTQPAAQQQKHQGQGWEPPLGRYVPQGGAAGYALGEPGDEAVEPAGGCSRCASLTFNAEWHKAFGVVLCNQCKRDERLISKSTAKQQYSVSDGDLSRLGSLRKANPHKKDWQAMHLYMESQVARLAHSKHGGAEGLHQHQQARLEARLESRLKRRQQEKDREAAEEARLARIRQRIEEEAAQRAEEGGAAASGSDVEEI